MKKLKEEVMVLRVVLRNVKMMLMYSNICKSFTLRVRGIPPTKIVWIGSVYRGMLRYMYFFCKPKKFYSVSISSIIEQ